MLPAGIQLVALPHPGILLYKLLWGTQIRIFRPLAAADPETQLPEPNLTLTLTQPEPVDPSVRWQRSHMANLLVKRSAVCVGTVYARRKYLGRRVNEWRSAAYLLPCRQYKGHPWQARFLGGKRKKLNY